MTAFESNARFEAALEECCRRVRRGEALERCLADYPAEYHAELARLVPLGVRVRRLGSDPSPEFQFRLEQHLLAAVDDERAKREPQQVGGPAAWRLAPVAFLRTAPAIRLAVLGLAALLLVGVGGAGVVQASEDSLPDSPLYQVKTAREWLRLVLTRDSEARVGVFLDDIAQRGRELQRAVVAGKGGPVVQVLAARLAMSTERVVGQALELHERGRSAPAARSLVALRETDRRLERLAQEAAPDARPTLQRLRAFLREQEQRLQERGVSASQPLQPPTR